MQELQPGGGLAGAGLALDQVDAVLQREATAQDGVQAGDAGGQESPVGVKVGDRVLFGKYSGQTVKVDGDELLVMKEEDLFAVVEK
jgi:co-chaperonin GroES (HSP10)